MTVHYNEMLMMLYNMPKNAAIFADFDKWDENENKLIALAKKTNNDLILVQKELNNFNHIISSKGIEQKAKELNCELVLWHSFNEEYDYSRIKQDLNITKAFVFDNNKDLLKIKENFEDIEILNYDQKLNLNINKLEELLKNGKVKEYQKLNGFNFGFKGFIEHGNHIGRTINYPTANIVINNELVLKEAVYITTVKLPNDDKKYPSISAYWTNKNGINVFETHIINFNQDIYGWGVEIELVEFIRESIKVKDLDELKCLLNDDKQKALEYFKGE
ncbi:hypothetical protein CK556_01855 [Mesoplasma chauliocola]|uniref:riboflavin kinase n=1 Tax=Mesoplasma chauliocola TaxID=216427 RepID=A0A249SNC2_9MOLU|nr:riboflavin kinase [Mesoplasma chauliocola]ASZ09099.1 hypothetical protein CK556_01855 [Mesoplasma chauliocola]